MSTGHHAFMRKEKGEKIIKVPLHQWASWRKRGYVFSDENKYNEQMRNSPELEADDRQKVSKKKKAKVMRRH